MEDSIRKIAEQCSFPNPKINVLNILKLRPYLEDFFDSNWLNAKLDEYELWALNNSDPTLQRNLLHRPINSNFIVAVIWASRSWEKEFKKDKNFQPPMGAKRLINIAASFAVLELFAGASMDNEARKHIRQRLQASDQIWGLVHECNTYAYFIRKGIEVEPLFLKKANREELLLHLEGKTVPVQCKCKPPGSGRAISQENFTTLAGCIARDIGLTKKKLFIRINSTGQIQEQDIQFLRDKIRGGNINYYSPIIFRNKQRIFCIQIESLQAQTTGDSFKQKLKKYDLYLTMGIAEPLKNSLNYETKVIVGIDAKPREKPWKSLERSIKDGVKQLPHEGLGIVAIHYIDPIEDFEQIRPKTNPLRFEIAKLIRATTNLGAVMLSCEPDLQLPGDGNPGQSRWYCKEEWSVISALLLGK